MEANIGHFDMCVEAVRDVPVRAVERSRGERSSSTDTLPEAIPETIREETVDDEPVNEWTSQSDGGQLGEVRDAIQIRTAYPVRHGLRTLTVTTNFTCRERYVTVMTTFNSISRSLTLLFVLLFRSP